MEWTASARAYDNCILAADIDMTGLDWTPKALSGTFDGQGHTISNLTVTASSGDTAACYWSDSGSTSGVGSKSSPTSYTDNTEKVESDWSGAMSAMNMALKQGGYSYSYKANNGSDSTSFPLVLN